MKEKDTVVEDMVDQLISADFRAKEKKPAKGRGEKK